MAHLKRPRSTLAWLGYGVVPYRFRGDRDALPTLDWDPAAPGDRKSLQKAITEFKNRSRDHQEREERRLAYVAVTRARQDLLLSGSQWGGQRDARRPSPYLDEVIAALGLEPVALDETAENPYEGRSGATLQWPLDPLGGRAPAVLEAAGEVGAALAAPERAHPTEELDRLLRERAARAAPPAAAAPSRVAASRFKDFVEDFDKTVRALNRPLPERPFRQTRIGTLFHAWVENRSGLVGLSGSLDDGLWEADEEALESESALADAAEMDRLTSIFLASEWGRLQPIEVETEIDVTLGGATGLVNVICKLDAVYRRADRGGRIEIVDWKTGRPPATDAERDERMLQLALYRVAYHKRHGVPLADIDVALYYVADDLVIRSDRVYSEAELVQRWNAAREARSASRSASA